MHATPDVCARSALPKPLDEGRGACDALARLAVPLVWRKPALVCLPAMPAENAIGLTPVLAGWTDALAERVE